MSAPDTNIEAQENNHKPALLGIKGAMIFGAVMLFLMIAFTLLRSTDPTAGELSGAVGADGETSTVTVDPVVPGTNVSN